MNKYRGMYFLNEKTVCFHLRFLFAIGSLVTHHPRLWSRTTAPFGCADKPAEKHCWLICCERKTLFWLKKQAEKDGL
jgi:hypothetical protein